MTDWTPLFSSVTLKVTTCCFAQLSFLLVCWMVGACLSMPSTLTVLSEELPAASVAMMV